jgi:putative DNA primase/helicase
LSNLLAAIALERSGFSVFPVNADKRPLVKWADSEHERTPQEKIKNWWANWPDAGIGIACGEVSNLSVVDVDGPKGVESLKLLGLPKTYTVGTPRPDGYHLYFQFNPGFKQGADFLPGIDCRTTGGYVVAPPSFARGKGYEGFYVVRRHMLPAAVSVVPDALTGHQRAVSPVAASETRDPSWVSEALRGVPESQRNDTTARLAGYFWGKNVPRDVIVTLMLPYATGCSPPMDQRELETTIDSILRYPAGRGEGLTDRPNRQNEGNLLL